MSQDKRTAFERNGMRVISIAGGRFQAQRFMGGKGLNKALRQLHRDPWENIGGPKDDRQAALAVIS